MFKDLLGELLPPLLVLIAAIWKYKDEQKKNKLEIQNLELENENLKASTESLKRENKDYEVKLQFFDKVMDLPFINEVSNAVERIFDSTKADRFLILVARNGKDNFKVVSVVFEQHKSKEYRINAIARYRNVEVDDIYRVMLKQTEFTGMVELATDEMEDSILKDFYIMEGVKFSKIRHLARKPIDDDNDFLMYASLSTHEPENFNRQELAFIKTQYEGVILPALEQVMN